MCPGHYFSTESQHFIVKIKTWFKMCIVWHSGCTTFPMIFNSLLHMFIILPEGSKSRFPMENLGHKWSTYRISQYAWVGGHSFFQFFCNNFWHLCDPLPMFFSNAWSMAHNIKADIEGIWSAIQWSRMM